MTGDVAAVILAAGSSTRMRSPKQILRFRGLTLIRRAALVALEARCRPVIVVTGANAAPSRSELQDLDVREAWNRDWESGMASSIRTGIEAVLAADPDVAAVVLMLCDQPYVTAEVIAALAVAHRVTGKPVVASAYGGSFGAPALFSRALFADLSGLEGAGGAKQVISRYAANAHFVPFPGGKTDLDTPDDFARLLATG